MADAFVLQTLRTARTKASPRGGFAGTSPVDLLVSLQRELVRRTDLDPGRVEDVIIGCASQNAEQGANIARTAMLAVEKVIARAGLLPRDIDVFEFAEAFAALCLRFRRDLDAGPDRMNPNGGTIAMGRAFGATGAILLGCLVDELERRDGRYGVAAVSGAAGLGVAVLVERVAS